MQLIKHLKLFITILLVLLSLQTVKPQAAIKLRSTFGSGGSSKLFVTKGQHYYLLQSIGQSSVIGLNQNNQYLLRQGFIQPLNVSQISIPLETLYSTVYPNPFTDNITIVLGEELAGFLFITITDLNGKIVYLRKEIAAPELNLNVGSLAPSIYILKVNTITKCFYSKVIKF